MIRHEKAFGGGRRAHPNAGGKRGKNKKADAGTHLLSENHVGLLRNWPSGDAGLPIIQSTNTVYFL